MSIDYTAELTRLQSEVTSARNRLSELEGMKKMLGNQRSQIVALCKQAEVEPKRETVEAAIAQTEEQLQSLITQIDSALKKEC